MTELKNILFEKADSELKKLVDMTVLECYSKGQMTAQKTRTDMVFELMIELKIIEDYNNRSEKFEAA